jgi:hypothetical protein
MDPVASFSFDTFRDRVGEEFTLPDTGVALELAKVEDYGAGAGVRPAGAFSLFFAGPPSVMLPQGIHAMEHRELGRFALFLVPLGATESAVRYEAAFN